MSYDESSWELIREAFRDKDAEIERLKAENEQLKSDIDSWKLAHSTRGFGNAGR